MYELRMFYLTLLVMTAGVHCVSDCDCNTINALQELMQKELFQIKLENSKLASRLMRLEASNRHASAIGQPKSVTDLGKNVDKDPKIELRLDKIENELVSFSNKIERIDDRSSMVLKLDNTLKKTLREEKGIRAKFQSHINEKVKHVNNYSRNITGEIEKKFEHFKSEILQKQNTIKKEVTNQSQVIGQLKNETMLKHEKLKEKINSEVAKLKENTEEQENTMDETFEKFKYQMKETKLMISKLEKGTAKDKTENTVFFTAHNLREEGSNAIFPETHHNVGGGYDKSTGKFTCKVPGIYIFSFQISKKWNQSTDIVLCYLKINNRNMLGAIGDPYGDDRDGYSISVTGTFHLNRNDVVNVGGCHGLSYVHTCIRSSFTGVLISADD